MDLYNTEFEKRALKLIDDYEEAFEKEKSKYKKIRGMTILPKCAALVGDLDRALELAKKCLILSETLPAQYKGERMDIILSTAMIQSMMKNFREAKTFIGKAKKLAVGKNKYDNIYVKNKIAELLMETALIQKDENLLQECKDFVTSEIGNADYKANEIAKIAVAYYKLGNRKKSLKCLEIIEGLENNPRIHSRDSEVMSEARL